MQREKGSEAACCRSDLERDDYLIINDNSFTLDTQSLTFSLSQSLSNLFTL